MQDSKNRQAILNQVRANTRKHNEWHELDHVEELIHYEGFDGDTVRGMMPEIMNAMLETRAEMMR